MGRPGVGNESALIKELLLRDQWRLFIEQQMVQAQAKLSINILQTEYNLAVETPGLCQRVELPNVVGVMNDRPVLCSVCENQVLHKKLDITDTTGSLFQIELLVVTFVESFSHSTAHGDYVTAKRVFVNAGRQGLCAYAFEIAGDGRAACDGASPKECLVLPGPRVFFLVTFERLNIGDQQSRLAIRAQSGIDFVEHSRSGLCRQKMHKSTHQASEKHCVIQWPGAVRLLA